MAKKNPKETPMMKQYFSFKQEYPGALLLFRVGDFYETFGEDAVLSSQILGITLTKRHNGAASEIELAGFPHHALDAYLPKLVRAGQRVAICDQIEDPRFAKKLVKRGVTELVTPGVSYNDHVLDIKRNNFLAAVCQEKECYGLAFLDISTGEFFAAEGNKEYADKLLHSFEPAELLYSKGQRKAFQETFSDENFSVFFLEDWFFNFEFGEDLLKRHFKTKSLKGYGVADFGPGISAAGAIIHYLEENKQKNLGHINRLSRLEEGNYVWLDQFTIRNLELLFPQQAQGVALVDVLDQTQSPMGGRLLRKWIALPLKDPHRIQERLDIVDLFYHNPELLDQVHLQLKSVGDVERLISKVASQRVRPRELVQVKKGLRQTREIRELLKAQSYPEFQKMADQFHTCDFLLAKIEKELLDEPKSLSNEGGLIRDGVNAELDELRGIVSNSKDYLEQVRQLALDETGISSLKIGYNKVFGYYLEVTNAHKNKVPKSWIRKQTLTNAERYITEELKVYEDKIVHAEEKIFVLEQQLYEEIVREAGDYVPQIQQNGRILATLDCLQSFARLALKYKYTRPLVNEETAIDIKAGRHPVIERQLGADEAFIPNDTFLDNDEQQILVITGPNMAGKSALLRQVALITLMAQIGSFVPAESAEIGIVDKIFTRVGASDNLAKGESTFMVEMMETASIMNNLSERSLVLMDEIGRGTSTYDGISIAWAILEYLHHQQKNRPKTLFATHYHELNELAKDFSRIKNFHISIKELGNKIVFLRKLTEGGSEHSFGIHVAQMAGMPREIVLRANEIMQHLEENRAGDETREKIQELPKQSYQMNIFEPINPRQQEVIQQLKLVDLERISPIEALLKLNELKNLLKNNQ